MQTMHRPSHSYWTAGVGSWCRFTFTERVLFQIILLLIIIHTQIHPNAFNPGRTYTHPTAIPLETLYNSGNLMFTFQTGVYLRNYFQLPTDPTHLIKVLTAHNWQKWKRVFLTCHCHKIYMDEAVGLKSCKNTWKITIFVKMCNLGQYRENLIFCQ